MTNEQLTRANEVQREIAYIEDRLKPQNFEMEMAGIYNTSSFHVLTCEEWEGVQHMLISALTKKLNELQQLFNAI